MRGKAGELCKLMLSLVGTNSLILLLLSQERGSKAALIVIPLLMGIIGLTALVALISGLYVLFTSSETIGSEGNRNEPDNRPREDRGVFNNPVTWTMILLFLLGTILSLPGFLLLMIKPLQGIGAVGFGLFGGLILCWKLPELSEGDRSYWSWSQLNIKIMISLLSVNALYYFVLTTVSPTLHEVGPRSSFRPTIYAIHLLLGSLGAAVFLRWMIRSFNLTKDRGAWSEVAYELPFFYRWSLIFIAAGLVLCLLPPIGPILLLNAPLFGVFGVFQEVYRRTRATPSFITERM